MTRALWLPEKLEAWGVRVDRTPGWESRGGGLFDPRGVICHHTGGISAVVTDISIVTNGRPRTATDPGVPGPLCQVLLTRDGVAHVISVGRANHAGAGSYRGLSGNGSVFGIEASNSGRGEPWPAIQIDAYHRVVAAMLDGLHLDASWCCAHREWTPRKIDPAGIDMPQFRAAVGTLLARGTAPAPAPAPAPVIVTKGLTVDRIDCVVQTDSDGNGWLPTIIPWAKFRGASTMGSCPERDHAYWSGEAHAQNQGGCALITVTGARKSGAVTVFVNVAH